MILPPAAFCGIMMELRSSHLLKRKTGSRHHHCVWTPLSVSVFLFLFNETTVLSSVVSFLSILDVIALGFLKVNRLYFCIQLLYVPTITCRNRRHHFMKSEHHYHGIAASAAVWIV